MKKPLIVIAGPTACGKTDVSIRLAELIGGEIISADSMQVYKGMDIGTAKVMPHEMHGIKHYLIDELYPDEEFSVSVFQKKALEYTEKIYSAGKIPIIAGGTGFYINAVIYKNDFDDNSDGGAVREELNAFLEKNGKEALYDMLKSIDLPSCEKIHINNTKKVIRAIEYYRMTGKRMSDHNIEESEREPAFDYALYALNMDRKRLYDRIEKRVDIMLRNGLENEVRQLLKKYPADIVSMQGLGYKELAAYINGSMTLDEAVDLLKKSTRHFAKRQLTWFKNKCKNVRWVDMDKYDAEGAAHFIAEDAKQRLGITEAK